MIIYKRKKKQLVIPCGLGPVVCPDTGYDLQAKTVDSSTVLQIIEPDSGYYGMYRVTINPLTDDNLLRGNIKAGVEILGVLGTYAGELINLQAKQVDPSINQFTVTPDASYNGLSQVIVNAVTADIDPDIQAGNIKKDVEILGVIGTFEGGSLGTKIIDSSTVSQTVTPDASDYGLSSVTVNPYTTESKSETITENGQYTFNPSTADTLSSVTVDVSVAGGSTINNQDKTVDSSTLSQSITCDNGYTGLGTVTVNPYRLRSKSYTLTQNISSITLIPGEGYDGLSDATVTVSITGEDVSANITQNGSYSYTSSDPYNLLNRVDISVNVPGGTLGTKTVDSSTVSQTVTPNSGDYGLSSVTVNPYTLDSKTVNSSTSSQTVTSDADGLSSVTVNPYTVESKSATLTSNGQYTYTATNADALSSVTVDVSIKSALDLQSKTVNSSTSQQIVQADSSYDGLSQVTVNPYTLQSKTLKFQELGDSSVKPDSSYNGLSEVDIHSYGGSVVSHWDSSSVISGYQEPGRIDIEVNKGVGNILLFPALLQDKVVDPSTSSQVITNDDYDSSLLNNYYCLDYYRNPEYLIRKYQGLHKVTINPVTSSIDSNIQANNIKDGVTILGVQGTYQGSVINNQSKTVDSSTISQTVTSDAGYTGLSSVTVNPYTLDSSTVDPSTSQITVTSAEDGLSSVTINAVTSSIDNNIAAGNIKDGVTILGITGTYAGQSINNQNKTVDSSTVSQTVTFNSGYTGLGTVTVNPYNLQQLDVFPEQYDQTINPSSGYDGFSSVWVMGRRLQSKNVDASTLAQTIRADTDQGYWALSSVTVNAAPLDSSTVDPSTSQQVITPALGDYGLSSVTVNAVTSSIDNNITAGNIKNGVTILGVQGTYSGETTNYDNIYNALLEI